MQAKHSNKLSERPESFMGRADKSHQAWWSWSTHCLLDKNTLWWLAQWNTGNPQNTDNTQDPVF